MVAIIKNFEEVIGGKHFSYRRSSQDACKWALFIFPKGKDALLDIEDVLSYTFPSKYVTEAQVKQAFSQHA